MNHPAHEISTHSIEISVVIPTLNEEENVVAIATIIREILHKLALSYEIIFIDNGSHDNTVPLIKSLCVQFPSIKLIVNTRNFGQLRSPVHGIYQAQGRAVIGLCADFQDPPELIPEFIRRWKNGTKIVLGVRRSEANGWLLRFIRSLAYYTLNLFSSYPVIANATGFGLYDAEVVQTLSRWNEPEPVFRTMLVESGYSIETVPYDRPLRQRGTSKNNFLTLASFALSAFVGAGQKLLRLPLIIGMLLAVMTFITFLLAAGMFLSGKESLYCVIAGAVEMLFCLCFICLGVMAEHIRIISERTRSVPLVTEKERINF